MAYFGKRCDILVAKGKIGKEGRKAE